MRRLLFGLFICLTLIGCAVNSGVIPMGQGMYMVSRQAATGFSGLGNLKANAIAEAQQFCATQEAPLNVVRTNESHPPYVMGNFPKAEIQFSCSTQYSEDEIRSFNREKLLKLYPGMSKEAAVTLMGTDVFIGEGIRINNPYRTALFPVNEKTYEVYFYYTDRKKADGAITDDELTPIIFEAGKVVGWGVEFLDKNVIKQEIRNR